MSHRTTFVYTRPNTTVQWYVQSPSYVSLFKTELEDTGKINLSTPVYSEDGLTKTHSAVWPNDADRVAWIARETTQTEIGERTAYCAANAIVLDISYDDI